MVSSSAMLSAASLRASMSKSRGTILTSTCTLPAVHRPIETCQKQEKQSGSTNMQGDALVSTWSIAPGITTIGGESGLFRWNPIEMQGDIV